MTETPEHRRSPSLDYYDEILDTVPVDPDAKTTVEVRESEDLDEAAKRAAVAGVIQNIKERKKYAKYIFGLTVGWLTLMGVILLAQGFNWKWFELHDSVLIAVVTTTTTGIVGLLVLVVKYLFPTKDSAAQ